MNTIKTQGIVLGRTDYQESNRIINFLTADQGKLALMARGVRKPKSKLAAGIELFSVSSISFIKGRGDIGTLISARAEENYSNIVKDINRVQSGYSMIKLLNHSTEDHAEDDYFSALHQALSALNDQSIDADFIESWFSAQLLRISGHAPNLITDSDGQKLSSDDNYIFDIESMCFRVKPGGNYSANAIKSLRLMFSPNKPQTILNISGFSDNLKLVVSVIRQMQQFHLS